MAKGDMGGGGMMGRFRNAAMAGGIGAMKGQNPGGFGQGGRFGRGGPMGMGMGNYQFGQGQTPIGGSRGNMIGPSMPQIQPNPEFEKAYGQNRDAGMDFPAAMDQTQNQMGGFAGGFARGNPGFGRGIMAPMGGSRRGMMF